MGIDGKGKGNEDKNWIRDEIYEIMKTHLFYLSEKNKNIYYL